MRQYLVLRLEGPLQAWGDVAMDPVRPTRAYPSRSGLAGLLANALGWRYRDADRTTALQDALRYAVREDQPATLIRDYQTADLSRTGLAGWTRWGIERREGSAREGTQILEKFYLADGAFTVVVTLSDDGTVTLDELERALRYPARPLFLGRRGCPPSSPILGGSDSARVAADSALAALLDVPLDPPRHSSRSTLEPDSVRIWHGVDEGVTVALAIPTKTEEVWDRRDFRSNRFGGSRGVVEARLPRDSFKAGRP